MPGLGLDESRHAIRRRSSESSDLPPNADRPLSVEKRESVFLVRTADGGCEAKNVEIATGLYQSPKVPAFAKLFKQSMGASPHQCILQRRLERAKELLRNPALSLSDISLDAGFADQSHFTNIFRRFAGATPSKFRSTL